MWQTSPPFIATPRYKGATMSDRQKLEVQHVRKIEHYATAMPGLTLIREVPIDTEKLTLDYKSSQWAVQITLNTPVGPQTVMEDVPTEHVYLDGVLDWLHENLETVVDKHRQQIEEELRKHINAQQGLTESGLAVPGASPNQPRIVHP
jgi:hypothetical protein